MVQHVLHHAGWGFWGDTDTHKRYQQPHTNRTHCDQGLYEMRRYTQNWRSRNCYLQRQSQQSTTKTAAPLQKRQSHSGASAVETPCWRQRGTLRSSALRILMQSRALLPAPVANTSHSQCQAGGTRSVQTAGAKGRHGSARLQLRAIGPST